jgi:CIC family chloride channel protein
MMVSNTAGVTGGVFLPTLSFGAIVGSLCGQIMVSLGLIDSEHYILIVVLGIVAFLGATSHVPVTACVFALEALGGFNNVLAVIIAVTVSFLIVEIFGGEDFTDTVIESKLRSSKKGKTATIVDVPLTVGENAFAIGKQLRDILWPNDCTVVSIEHSSEHRGNHEISQGDVITVHYKTYNPTVTAEELKILMGKQSNEIEKIMNPS